MTDNAMEGNTQEAPGAASQIAGEGLPGAPAIPSAGSRRGIAPWWHTLIFVAFIGFYSWAGARNVSHRFREDTNHLALYARTAGMELLLAGWVWFGIALRKVSLRTLMGRFSGGLRTVTIDIGIAAIFWLCAMSVLGTVGMIWQVTESIVEHRPLLPIEKSNTPGHAHKPDLPADPEQKKLLEMLSHAAPVNGKELAAWALLCAVVGFAEELVFRGYLQQQFAAWFGAWPQVSVVCGVAFSALVFGAAHGYEGIRGMVLIGVFGALFSVLVLLRRNLRAGMIAHGWHDLFTMIALVFLKRWGFI